MDHTPYTMEQNQTNNDRVELLAPAGDWECVQAAVENGADAIYFGLDCGFNARYRAQNFGLGDLSELSKWLHRRSVKGYATLNTLVFPDELADIAKVIEAIAIAGIDAVLVQDFGVARLVKSICPDLEIHASTQMSLTSAETIEVAQQLGLSRVVLARELSVKEITRIAQRTDMPLEVFIHGALCVAYSGQCLTSESLGGRSANRGQCAQACRLPYELITDGKETSLGDVRYLLSPQDLAGYASIPELFHAGVASLKIEGRLKSPEYVANITSQYRRAIDSVIANQKPKVSASDREEMELSFSRGFSPGWLEGNDHKRLVPGIDSSKRGIFIGEVLKVGAQEIGLSPASKIALGDGLAIRGLDEENQSSEQGGRIYSLRTDTIASMKQTTGHLDRENTQNPSPTSGKKDIQMVWVGFGRGEIDFSRIRLGDRIFKNDDPQLNRRLRKSFSGEKPHLRRRLNLHLEARVGEPLKLSVASGSEVGFAAVNVIVVGDQALEPARNQPANAEGLKEKIARLGGTPFFLGKLTVDLEGAPMVPVGMLNQLRRDLVEDLLHELERQPHREVDRSSTEKILQPILSKDLASTEPVPNPLNHNVTTGANLFSFSVLCRTLEQVKAMAQCNVDLIYADFHDVREYRDAVKVAHSAGKEIGLASVRIQKPSEMGLLKALVKNEPDYVLARNLAAIDFAAKAGINIVADFSLNVANHRSAEWIRSIGAQRVTVSYDLNREQVAALCDSMPTSWMEVVIHQHMPMFHMEHCVFCSVLSPGTDKTNCGRPCDHHEVKLRDRVGAEHPLHADVACRNTLYNSVPQSGAEIAPQLLQAGVNWFRLELLEQSKNEAIETVELYRQLLSGQVMPREVWSRLRAANRIGVTRGTLEAKRNPLAIL